MLGISKFQADDKLDSLYVANTLRSNQARRIRGSISRFYDTVALLYYIQYGNNGRLHSVQHFSVTTLSRVSHISVTAVTQSGALSY